MDLITDLPLSHGFNSIFVVVDHSLTKGVILLSCNKTITAKQVAKLLLENLYKQFGLPDKFISDRGPQFVAHAFRELLKLLGITGKLSTAYCQGTPFHFQLLQQPRHLSHLLQLFPKSSHSPQVHSTPLSLIPQSLC